MTKVEQFIDRTLPTADPFDPDAMAAHRVHLHRVLDEAIDRPGDFYFQLTVVGREPDAAPYSHGTLGPALAFATANVQLDFMDKMALTELTAMVDGDMKAVYNALATGTLPEAPTPEDTGGELTAATEEAGAQAQDSEAAEIDEIDAILSAIFGEDAQVAPGVYVVEDEAGRHEDDGCPHCRD